MTERDLYDAALIEINKLEAPSMLLEDYNYFINKAIQQYINKAYNRYEINQQATDDLGVLKTSSTLNVITEEFPKFPGEKKYYYCKLPSDYWHILSCIVTFENDKNASKCSSQDELVSTVARKLTADIYPTIINNAYFKPSPKCPYYNIQLLSDDGTRVLDSIINPCIISGGRDVIDEIIDPCNLDGHPYSGYVINLFCGNTKKIAPNAIMINYLRTPRKVQLTEDDLDGEDRTSIMEFPDYVCYEIINEFVKLLLENTVDPRLSTNIPINQSIIGEISAE